MPLPAPLDDPARERPWKPLSDQATAPLRVPPRRHLRRQRAQARDKGGGGRARPEVPLRPRQALHPREQLDVPAAAPAQHGALREVPDLLRGLPHLRGQRPQRALPADVPLRDHAPAVLQVRQARRHALGLAARRHRAELAAGRPAHRTRLPLQPVPALRADLPDRRGQRPDRPRAAEALQPGDGHRAQGAPRQRARCCSSRSARPPA